MKFHDVFHRFCQMSKFPWHFVKFPDNSLTLRNFISPWHFPDSYEPWPLSRHQYVKAIILQYNVPRFLMRTIYFVTDLISYSRLWAAFAAPHKATKKTTATHKDFILPQPVLLIKHVGVRLIGVLRLELLSIDYSPTNAVKQSKLLLRLCFIWTATASQYNTW